MQINQFNQELTRCLGCKTKPCEKACPLGVSPHDFIAVSKQGDFGAAANIIAKKNPLPQTCGLICPEIFCQKACIRAKIDSAIEIPCLQAKIMERGGYPTIELPQPIGKKAAIIGGGAAGLGALNELLLAGWHIDIFEKNSVLGGAARLIPEHRLPKSVLDFEIKRLVENDRVTLFLNTEIKDFDALKEKYDGVILALGEPKLRTLNIKGEEHCIPYTEYLAHSKDYMGQKIAVSGGGEVALDCAITAKRNGCEHVEMFVRRRREDMRISPLSRQEIAKHDIIISDLTSITAISRQNDTLSFEIIKNRINQMGKAEPCIGTNETRSGYNILIQALGAYYPKDELPPNQIIAGDMTGQGGMIVQALSSGKEAALKLINGETL